MAVMLLLLLHVMVLVGDRLLLLPVLVGRGLKPVKVVLQQLVLYLPLQVPVGARSLMLFVLVGGGLPVVVVCRRWCCRNRERIVIRRSYRPHNGAGCGD
jgi:hypothetical protein